MQTNVFYNKSSEKMDQISSDSIDLIVTDPPYNISEGKQGYGNIYQTDFGDWDKKFNPKKFIKEFDRVLKKTGSIYLFTSAQLFGTWWQLLEPLFDSMNFIVWQKTNCLPSFQRKNWRSGCELIIFGKRSNKSTFNFGEQKEMINIITNPPTYGKIHPTQKPIKLLEKLILTSSNPGDLILDPFAGSGSTLIAAQNKDRKFIGYEVDKKYYLKAENEIAKNLIQTA